jgi:hypothetical protein
MNEVFPIVKILDSIYDALYMANHRHCARPQTKNIFSTKFYLPFV